MDATASVADRARADRLWKRIEGAVDKGPPDARRMHDIVDLIGLASRETDGLQAVKREISKALREQLGAMRQRWLNKIMSE